MSSEAPGADAAAMAAPAMRIVARSVTIADDPPRAPTPAKSPTMLQSPRAPLSRSVTMATDSFKAPSSLLTPNLNRAQTMASMHQQREWWMWKRRKNRPWIIAAVVVGLLIFGSLVAVFALLSDRDGRVALQTSHVSTLPSGSFSRFSPSASGPGTPTTPSTELKSVADVCSSGFNVLQIFANISSIDTTGRTIGLHLYFIPCGDFAEFDTLQGTTLLRVPMNVTLGTNLFSFPRGVPMQTVDTQVRLASGDSNSYPFDSYESSQFFITGIFLDPQSQLPRRLPIIFALVGALQTYSISFPSVTDVSQSGDGTSIRALIRVARSPTTIVFSVFVIMVMWLLSLLTFMLTLVPWVRRYRCEAPTLAIPNTLLFALPALRLSQPGIPQIGCTADVVSFFWCEILTAISAITLISNYIYFSLRPPQMAPSNLARSMTLKRSNTAKPSSPTTTTFSESRLAGSRPVPTIVRRAGTARPGQSDASNDAAKLAAERVEHLDGAEKLS